MAFTNLFLGEVFGDGAPDPSALRFASRLLPRANGHLTAALGALILDLSAVELLPMAEAAVKFVNDERQNAASAAARNIENLGMTEGFVAETHVVQKPQQALVEYCVSLARLADLCVFSRPTKELGAHMGLVEGILFHSGRPVLLVPPDCKDGGRFSHVTIAWDGSARAARAVGDATSIISDADCIQIVCVSEDLKRNVAGADLAAQLSRRCKKVEVIDLPAIYGDVGRAIRNHIELTRSELLIMGAYAHARLWELVVGGVTSSMMQEATIPVFMSY
jgi:nucleotide-binding universal stress UspA family protein